MKFSSHDVDALHTFFACLPSLKLVSLLPFASSSLVVQVDDEDLQDEPLQVTVLDHDTYSANDAIGKVYIDIDPLLCNEAASVISGWFPIYDTIHGTRINLNDHDNCDLYSLFTIPHLIFVFLCLYLLLGIRGEINVLVKVELFNDLNRFRQSSCGVKFFCSTSDLTFASQLFVYSLKDTVNMKCRSTLHRVATQFS